MKSFTTYIVASEHAGLTLEEYLKGVLQYSGRKIQKLTRQKGILLNGKTVFLQKKVKNKDTIRMLVAADPAYGVEPEEGKVEILYEDDAMLVVNKPAGQLVHPAGQTTGGTLANYLAYHLKRQGILRTIRPVHRLDKDTSGCVIFAKDDHSQFILEQQLKNRTLKRMYWALVKGNLHPEAGTIAEPIGSHPVMANRRTVNEKGDPAVTHYQTLQKFPEATLAELTLDTGRTHQIRVHLSHIGCPVIGDGMYGVRVFWMKRQALHAHAVYVKAPGRQEEIRIEAPLPQDFLRAIEFCSKEEQL